MLEGFLLGGCKGRGVSLYSTRTDSFGKEEGSSLEAAEAGSKALGTAGAEGGSGGFGEEKMASGMATGGVATGGVDAGSGRTGRKGDEDGPLETVVTVLLSTPMSRARLLQMRKELTGVDR